MALSAMKVKSVYGYKWLLVLPSSLTDDGVCSRRRQWISSGVVLPSRRIFCRGDKSSAGSARKLLDTIPPIIDSHCLSISYIIFMR